MTKLNKLLVIIFALILIFILWQLLKNKNQIKQTAIEIKPSRTTTDKFQTLENEGGNVTVTVKPEILEIGKNPSFNIEFNTHSVELNFDVVKQAYLLDEKGYRITDAGWKGSSPKGHHRNGTLVFSQPLINTKFVELILTDIAEIPERKFRWKL